MIEVWATDPKTTLGRTKQSGAGWHRLVQMLGALTGPKSQYWIHRDKLKSKSLAPGENQLPGNYGELERDYRGKTQIQRCSPTILQHNTRDYYVS